MLLSLERRLARNPRLREQYVAFMREYETLSYMEVVPDAEINQSDAYYLPHHAVFKNLDPQSKIRVVFNASSRTSAGHSLKDTLLPGPKLQSDLWLIVTRWRIFRFAFTGDIKKMFRQIRIHREDTHLQRILWRSNPEEEVQDFRLLTVVYGTTSALYLAIRTLNQLIEDEQYTYPLGAVALRDHSYVDDILAGGPTLEHALNLQRQLIDLLKAGGFELGKWAANAPELCPDEEPIAKLFHDWEGVSTLGVLWNPADDCFALRVASLSEKLESHTKRSVLLEVARFFDPLG